MPLLNSRTMTQPMIAVYIRRKRNNVCFRIFHRAPLYSNTHNQFLPLFSHTYPSLSNRYHRIIYDLK